MPVKKLTLYLFFLSITTSLYSTDLDQLRSQAKENIKAKKFESAEKIYSQILKQDTTRADVISYLQLLLRNKKYNEAVIFCDQDYIKFSNDDYLRMFVNNVKHIDQYQKFDYSLLKISDLNFNTNRNESILSFYANGFLVNKSKSHHNHFSKKLYYTNLDVDFQKLSKFQFQDILKRKILTANYHIATKTLFYDCIIHKNKQDKTLSAITTGIVLARLDNYSNQWVDYKEFSFNSTKYNVKHPSMSKDGKRLYFVSDMPGGYGGYDVYYSEFKNYVWSKPENLGSKVNTPYDELYPFIFEDNVLYFSTEGRAGLGGLDIFEYRLSTTENATNIGAPFNSNADDFGIKKHPKLSYGFVNSNRSNLNRADINVYRFFQYKLPPKFIPVYIKDSLNKVTVSEVKLKVFSNKTKDLSTYLLTNGHTNELNFEIFEYYQFTASIQGYNDIVSTLKIDKNQSEVILYFNSDLDKTANTNKLTNSSQNIRATGIIKDFISNKPMSGVKATVKDIKDNSIVDTFMTDSSGKYILNKLSASNFYNLSFFKSGYEPYSVYITTMSIDKIIKEPHLNNVINNINLTEAWKEDPSLHRKLKYQTNTNKSNTSDVLESKKTTKVFYKINSVELDDMSKEKLEEFLLILKENMKVKLVVVSHTDAFGDAEYNRLLSLKRANTIAQYFVDNGVDIKRILAWGKGETQPLFMCDENNKCSKQQIQANRRTELKIIFKY